MKISLEILLEQQCTVQDEPQHGLVFKKILLPRFDSHGKRTPNYEDPYVVKTIFTGGSLILTTMDG